MAGVTRLYRYVVQPQRRSGLFDFEAYLQQVRLTSVFDLNKREDDIRGGT